MSMSTPNHAGPIRAVRRQGWIEGWADRRSAPLRFQTRARLAALRRGERGDGLLHGESDCRVGTDLRRCDQRWEAVFPGWHALFLNRTKCLLVEAKSLEKDPTESGFHRTSAMRPWLGSSGACL